MTTQEPLSAFLMSIFLSSARDLMAFHSSWDKLECLTGLSITVKSSSSTLLKKTSKCGSPLGVSQNVLVRMSVHYENVILNKCWHQNKLLLGNV